MEAKLIFGIIINIIFWPLIVYWIWKGNKNGRELLRNQREYYKPENKFKRSVSDLGVTLAPFQNPLFYPYIITPSFENRQKPVKPTNLDPDAEGMDFQYEINGVNKIKKGRTEFHFYKALADKFGFELIHFDDVRLKGFYPDIAYVDYTKKILIDIEIDEPYSSNPTEPIHYYQINQHGIVDDSNSKRDEVFKNSGWTVVRFSQDQVLKDTNQCIDIIDHIISYWSENASTYKIENAKSLLHSRWSLDQSLEFIRSKRV
jgi:hypothetical protein